MKDNDQAILLRKCSLWSELSEEEYHELDVADNFKEVKKGDYVYFEAFQHNIIYFIKKGHILLGTVDDNGHSITKDILQPGDFFGQFLLEKGSLDGEFAQAVKSDVSLCSFSIDNFLRLLKNNPALSLKYTKLVGFRLRKFENRFINIIQKDVRTRLLLFIQELLQRWMDSKPAATPVFAFPNNLNQEEMARLIGSSRQTVTTLLTTFKDDGILEYTRHQIRFPQGIRKLAEALQASH